MTNKAKKRIFKKNVIKITNGLLRYSIDLVLWNIYFGFSLPGAGSGSRGVHRAANKADEIIADLNYETFRNAFYSLKQKGLIKTAKGNFLEPEITKAGLKKLKGLVPAYYEKRVWDKNIYLINYDIPNEYAWYRNYLRDTLLTIKAAAIQKSLYITPYNPKGVLNKFTEEHGHYGDILISTLTKDSSINEEGDWGKLLWDYYKMDDINFEYEQFINTCKRTIRENDKIPASRLSVYFLSIVKKDPQLPFELLPDSYLGDEAYIIYKKIIS